MSPKENASPLVPGILLCFFLSGAAGLVYQVAWGKALGLIFGHTVYAIATVLAVFMGGLAAGSAWLGRWSERRPRPVALYGWIELGVAAAGALSLAGLAGVRALYLAAYPAVSGSAPLLLGLRFVGAAMVLFLPTFLMGGTLPILVGGLTRASAELGKRVSRLYWVNTLGAVGGTLAAGFLLLPALGLRRTVAVAVVMNVLAGVVALALSRKFGAAAPTVPVSSPADAGTPASLAIPENGAAGQSAAFLLTAFGIVGGTAIAYEIAWTRLLATILGSSTYAFTLMLATFLAGIVLGSVLFERWYARAGRVSLATFSGTQTWTAVAALLFLVFFHQLPNVVPPILRATRETFGGLVLAQFVTSALAMLPAAVVFGFNFPAVVVLLAGSRREGARQTTGGQAHYAAAVGRAYAANTLGAIVAAVIAGFWLVPRLGAFRVVALLAGINLFLALALALRSSARRLTPLAVNCALLAAVAFAGWSSAFYNRSLAAFGTVLYWNYHAGRLTIEEAAATTDLLFLADGLNASVAVSRTDDYLALKSNGKVDASNLDAPTQLLLGHLGAIFHPAPRRVLIIGFGGGMTVSAVARYPDVERIDCIEIEPAVLQAAPHLERLHRGVTRDPRLHIFFDDARNALLTSRRQYDLIISEPSNPWIAGIATLFTSEYYAAVRRRLAPGGIFVQWVQAYSLDPADLRMIFASIAPHFPEISLWHSIGPDLMVMARTDAAPLRFDRARSLWSNPGLREDFQTLHLSRPESWPAYFRLNDNELRQFAFGSVTNTDDRTLLEYRAPRALLNKDLTEAIAGAIERHQHSPLPSNLHPSEDRLTYEGVAGSLFELDRTRVADYLKELDNEPPTASLEVLRGRLALSNSRFPEAAARFESALRLDPNLLEAIHWLATVKHRTAAVKDASLLLTQVLDRDPAYLPALTARVQFAHDLQDWAAAATAQARLIAAMKSSPGVEYCRLGEFLLRAGNLPLAERALLEGIVHEPYSFSCHRNLGELYRATGRYEEARQALEFVVRYFPDGDAGTYISLAEVYRSLDRPDVAIEVLRKGRRVLPDDEALRKALPGS